MTPSSLVPSTQRALLLDEFGQLRVATEAGVPPLPPGYVLIKTGAVALNPSDYKILHNFPVPGAYVGSDFSGTVVEIAPDVDRTSHVRPGAVVSGTAFCFAPAHRLAAGAMAEYVRARADLLLRVPTSTLGYQSNPPADSTKMQEGAIGPLQAATLGTALATCIIAFWSEDALGLSRYPDDSSFVRPEKPGPQVLVYGGSTATGTIALQLLRLSGYDPIATCSPRNFELARSRGASAVFDYAASDVVTQIRAHTGGRLKYVLDCISTASSVIMCYDAIQRPGGRYASLESVEASLLARREAVRATFVLAAEVYGEQIELGHDAYDRPASADKHELAVRCMAMMQRLLDAGVLRSHPIEILQGGLQGAREGLDVLGKGGVSGKKLVAIIG